TTPLIRMILDFPSLQCLYPTIRLTVEPTTFFFFFQAEDGIRDDLVTGVQTCALPICKRPPGAPAAAYLPSAVMARSCSPLRTGKIGRASVGKECRSRWSRYH